MSIEHKEIEKLIQNNQLDLALQTAKDQLSQLPSTEFHHLLNINWLHLAEPMSILIDKFYKSSRRKIKSVAALYCEMNAFTINYDNWILQFFAYSTHTDRDDWSWLAEYDYTNNTGTVFTNLEKFQAIFKDYMENEKWHDQNLKKAFEISEYVIILGVQQLLKEASVVGKIKKFKWTTIPLYVTAHDYDNLIYNATNV